MGGRDGSRGYLYQALIAVLEALKDSRWQNICIEYESKDDKVDIALKDDAGMLNVMQVKSSINTFTINNINNWIDALINDVPDAEKFSLILIGNIDAKTKTYINSIDKLSRDAVDGQTKKDMKLMSENIQKYCTKIKIKVLNDDISSFELSMESYLNKLLYSEKIQANPNELELMVKALVYQFNVFSTNSQYITRNEFIENIVKWITFNYKVDAESIMDKYFDIMYYYKNEFSYNNMSLAFSSESINEELENSKKTIKELYSLVSKINLRKQENIMGINPLANLTFSAFTKDFAFDEDTKNIIKDYFINYVGVEVNEDFFDPGNLKEFSSFATNMYIKKDIRGTKNEEKKYNSILKICELIKQIPFLEKKIEYFEYLEQFKVLPLCLKNISSRYLQEIEVNIRIPKNIKILTPGKFKIPHSSVLEIIEETLETNLVATDDSNVKSYAGERLYTPFKMNLPMPGFSVSTKEKFNSKIKELFNYKIFENEDEYLVLNCVFSEMKSGDTMMFPMYLLVDIDSKFEIKYSVKSKTTSSIQEDIIAVI